MEIRQLKYFLKVAETLNFSEASRRLFITQSTLSQQISHLNRRLVCHCLSEIVMRFISQNPAKNCYLMP